MTTSDLSMTMAALVCALTIMGCSRGNGSGSFPGSEADKFISLTKIRNTGDDSPLADTLFRYSVPIPEEGSGEFIYMVNPGCSFCIANAISCYNAYLDSGSDIPFLFLKKSEDTLIFDYHLEKNSRGNPPGVFGEECDLLEDGIYCLIGERVVSHSRWN